MRRPDAPPRASKPLRRRRRALLLSHAVLAAVVTAHPAHAEVDRYLIDTGPLRIRDQFLPGLGYLGFDPVSADVLDAHEWQLDLVVTTSNTFAHSSEVERALESRRERSGLGLSELRSIEPDRPGDGIFYLDGEHTRWAIAARRGLGRGLQVELLVPVIRLGGGRLDSTIEGFHDAFSLDQAGRLGVPRNRFTTYVRSPRHEVSFARPPGTSLGDIVVGARYDLLRSRPNARFEAAVEGLVKVPTGSVEAMTSSGSADWGVQLLGTRYFRGNCLHFSVGAARLGRHELFELDPQTVLSGMLAWEIALGSRTTALAQATVSQSPFRDLRSDEIGTTSMQLTAGLKRAFGRNVFFLGITENVASFNNTADIGLHFGVTRVVGRR